MPIKKGYNRFKKTNCVSPYRLTVQSGTKSPRRKSPRLKSPRRKSPSGVKKRKKKVISSHIFLKGPKSAINVGEFRHSKPRKTGSTGNKKSHNSHLQDLGGLFSPYRKVNSYQPSFKERLQLVESPYSPNGLSHRETCYVISNCQARCSRYAALKTLAYSAIQNNKIFTIYGRCNPIRKALVERGWVEKLPGYRMNFSKINNGTLLNTKEINGELETLLLSHRVEKYEPHFIWRTKDEVDTTIDMNKANNTITNHLKMEALWTTKQGLCQSINKKYWFYLEDISEVIGPRTYNTYDVDEIGEFVTDYKLTACTSLLKWVLEHVESDRPIFVETGNISMNVLVFALNRCKEYLYKKQNKDIDHPLVPVNTVQWNKFLKKYNNIVLKNEVFRQDLLHELKLYINYAKFLLKEMYKYRPQLYSEGYHNIWIVKPAHYSRGRGIKMASKLNDITNIINNKNNTKFVIQKYIEEPLLIHETKFDIRQYYIVTSTFPLVIWMFKDCYLKFSSQKYDLQNYHESIHLTNNAVQKKYKNCLDRDPELPQNNMWDLERYKIYLENIGKDNVWEEIIYPGMRKSIIGVMMSCQDSMTICKNCFELYGCDFVLDEEYTPWLIEINSSPDLSPTTSVTARICNSALTDLIKVVIDHAANPKASTGLYECVYRQTLTMPRFGGNDLIVRGYALPLEYFYHGPFPIVESCDVNWPKNESDARESKTEKIKQDINKVTREQKYKDDVNWPKNESGARESKTEKMKQDINKVTRQQKCKEDALNKDEDVRTDLEKSKLDSDVDDVLRKLLPDSMTCRNKRYVHVTCEDDVH